MEILTKELAERLYKNHKMLSSDGGGSEHQLPVVSYFVPGSSWRWLISSGEPFGVNDFRMFGIVDIFGNKPEYGHVCLSELDSISVGPQGVIGVERSRFFTGRFPMRVYYAACEKYGRLLVHDDGALTELDDTFEDMLEEIDVELVESYFYADSERD